MALSQLEKVRLAVRREFKEFGWSDQAIEESVLLHESNYFGHRFSFKRWCAVWRLAATTIEIYENQQQINIVAIEEREDPVRLPVVKHSQPIDRAA